ncbi:hypothetical protein BDN72DRAFT_123103 [Pluteus cervinus]|uniref:Uncharacterized protein n=1 Tax=Pluteus cervinus TaxID=181527 RepID=A0ACD3B7K0_9AGAR|nr:hypothetical protein BDN72DRAFT_123103 [Pluteus cervinus]
MQAEQTFHVPRRIMPFFQIIPSTSTSPTIDTSGSITNSPININPRTSSATKTQPNCLAVAAPRSSSLPFVTMGQAFSKTNSSAGSASSNAFNRPTHGAVPQAASSSSSQLAATKGVVNAGMKLRRALARRKKDSMNIVVGDGSLPRSSNSDVIHEDTTRGGVVSSRLQGQNGSGPQQEQQYERQPPIQYAPSTSLAPAKVITASSPYSPTPPSSLPSSLSSSPSSSNFSTSPSPSISTHSPRSQRFAQLASQMFNAGRKGKAAAASTLSMSPPTTPPPVPSKAGLMQQQQILAAKRARPPSPVKTMLAQRLKVDNRVSIIPVSPGISSALNYMRMDAIEHERLMEDQEMRDRQTQPGPSSLPSTPLTISPESRESFEIQDVPFRASQDGQKEERKGTPQVPNAEMKEDWRKSDSTMSYHTIRPGSTNSSRPVSEAGSSHTVVPVKRLSALIGDADFGMPEEDDTDIEVMDASSFHADNRDSQWDVITPQATAPSSSLPSVSPSLSTPDSTSASISAAVKAKNRRSISLNVGPNGFNKLAGSGINHLQSVSVVAPRPLPQLPQHPPPTVSASFSMTTPSSRPYQHEITAVARANTGGIDIPNPAGHTSPADQGRKWAGLSPPSTNPLASTSTTSITGNSKPTPPSSYHSHPRHDRTVPAPLDNAGSPPPPVNVTSSTQPNRLPPNPMPSRTSAAPPIIRQTAISMTSTLAPAAGFARRAAEKMGWPWGGGHSSHGHGHSNNSSNANSGYSSSASSSQGHDEPTEWTFGFLEY